MASLHSHLPLDFRFLDRHWLGESAPWFTWSVSACQSMIADWLTVAVTECGCSDRNVLEIEANNSPWPNWISKMSKFTSALYCPCSFTMSYDQAWNEVNKQERIPIKEQGMVGVTSGHWRRKNISLWGIQNESRAIDTTSVWPVVDKFHMLLKQNHNIIRMSSTCR